MTKGSGKNNFPFTTVPNAGDFVAAPWSSPSYGFVAAPRPRRPVLAENGNLFLREP